MAVRRPKPSGGRTTTPPVPCCDPHKMQFDPAKYDDDRCLTNYIWDNYSSLLTDAEKLAAKTIRIQSKLPDAFGRSITTEELVPQPSPEVAQLLANGDKEFRRIAAARVLRENGGDLTINRCSKCNRIVRTPQARQCLWCGHNWHDATPGR